MYMQEYPISAQNFAAESKYKYDEQNLAFGREARWQKIKQEMLLHSWNATVARDVEEHYRTVKLRQGSASATSSGCDNSVWRTRPCLKISSSAISASESRASRELVIVSLR